MTSIEQRTFRGAFLGLISFVLTIIQSILLVPVFLTYWGDVSYGQFISVYVFIQLLRAIDTGHQIYVSNKFIMHYHQDKQEAYRILSSSMLIAFMVGFLELLIFVGIWNISDARSFLGIQFVDSPGLLIGILSMLIMWWLVGSVGGVLVKAILAKGFYAESVLVGIVMKVIEIVVITFAVVQDAAIGYVLIWLAAANFVYSIGVLYWIRIKMPEFYPWWQNTDFHEGLHNFSKSIVMTLNGFIEQFNSNGLIFIVTKFIGAAIVPVFTTIRTLSNSMVSITNLLVQPLVPEMLKFHSERNTSKVMTIVRVNWIFTGAFVNSFFLILVPLVEPLYSIWTKDSLHFDRSLFFLLAASVVMINYGKGPISYLTGINDLKSMSLITYARAILIFCVSFALLSSFGLIAIGWGVFIAEIVCSIILPLIFLKKSLHLSKHSFHYFIQSLQPVLMFGILFSLAYFFDEMISWISGLGVLITLSIYYLQWTSLEDGVRNRILALVIRKR